MSEEEQTRAGVTSDMVRISVGLETLDDILWDIDNALSAAAGA
jgi:O-acetylhomoserine (thiol)-lyase